MVQYYISIAWMNFSFLFCLFSDIVLHSNKDLYEQNLMFSEIINAFDWIDYFLYKKEDEENSSSETW